MKHYLQRMRGGGVSPPAAGGREILLGFIGSCIAIYTVGILHSLSMDASGVPLAIAPFGASAVLVFGAFRSPLAQPRNVVGGHVLSALVGVTAYQLLGDNAVMAVSLAVPTAIALMHMTQTLHPPGGATAFVTALGGADVQSLGYLYVLTPCAVGSVLLIAVALVVNNLPRGNRYPLFWL